MMIGFMLGVNSFLWSVSCNLASGSILSFSLIPVFDKTAYRRQRLKFDISVTYFYLGHFMLHILPCAFIMYYPPQSVSILHVWVAHIIQIGWAYCVQGSLFVDDIYVPLKKQTWYKLWTLAFMGHYIPSMMFREM